MAKAPHRGFSLVELVIVILLLGTLAVVALPRLQGKAGFVEFAYQNQLIAVLRNMQIRAMQDARSDFCYRINFINSNTSKAFGPASLDYNAGNQGATCSSAIDFSSLTNQSMRTAPNELMEEGIGLLVKDGSATISFIQFNSLGQPITSASNCSVNCTIMFSHAEQAGVCVESEGFIHAC